MVLCFPGQIQNPVWSRWIRHGKICFHLVSIILAYNRTSMFIGDIGMKHVDFSFRTVIKTSYVWVGKGHESEGQLQTRIKEWSKKILKGFLKPKL